MSSYRLFLVDEILNKYPETISSYNQMKKIQTIHLYSEIEECLLSFASEA